MTDQPVPVDPQALEIPFRTVGAALVDFARRHPDKTAIRNVDRDVTLDFSTLLNLVEDAAARMAALGVRRGSRVAVLSGECVEKLVLMLAAMRCGASACPFHAEISPDHLRGILRAISPALVVWRADVDGAALTSGLTCPDMPFDGFGGTAGFFAMPADRSLLPAAGTEYGPGDEGCIFATSGTTDRPKCVVWDHLGLWLCGLSTIHFTAMTADDRLLEYRTFSWLSPQIVTFMPFLSLGLTVVMAESFSRSRFFDWIERERVTVAAGVPTVINMLIDQPVDLRDRDVSSLRLIMASSAPLAPNRWRQFEADYRIRVLQFYGASEGGWLCGNRVDKCRIGTAGPPARHMDLAILGPDGLPCPAGTEGEIAMRGAQTAIATISADGVWEDRTPTRLVEWSRVGDLGIMDGDGFVTVTGRVKDVILRGGVSIAPLEIDAAVMRHPGVHEAAAIGVPDSIWGEEIACYVVARQGHAPTSQEISDHAARLLPDFKRPRHVVFVDSLPRNARGKVRRDDLKALWSANGVAGT
ncbi:MAG: class I adenylate-forming enzyme family protein [Rhodospirillaceae bacterium]